MVNLKNDADFGIMPNFYGDHLTTPAQSLSDTTPTLSLSGTTPTLSLSGTTPFEGVESYLSPFDRLLPDRDLDNTHTNLFTDFGDDFDDLPSLFGSTAYDGYDSKETVGNHLFPLTDIDDMYKISPGTPVIDDPTIQPFLAHVDESFTFPTRRKSTHTGIRKNITPESLVPLDAPIQPRKYRLPSAASRKEVPLIFARKRERAQTSGPDEDEPSVQSSLLEEYAIKVQRLQNSQRARRYLKRMEDAKVSFTCDLSYHISYYLLHRLYQIVPVIKFSFSPTQI